MTGMPAFGATHREEERWALVAFLRRLRTLKPEEYNLMVEIVGMKEQPGRPGGRPSGPEQPATKEEPHETH